MLDKPAVLHYDTPCAIRAGRRPSGARECQLKLFINTEGLVDYDQISEGTTVQDLLDAVDLFLQDQPLPCAACVDSCCKNSWSVEVDNISVRRLCQGDERRTAEFIRDKLVRKINPVHEFEQFVLKKDGACLFVTEVNRCRVYEQRPVICRLYLCNPKSYRYNVLRQIIGSAFLSALVLEAALREPKPSRLAKRGRRENPAVYAGDYTVLLADILDYAQSQGWLDQDDRDLCQAGRTDGGVLQL